MRRATPSLTQFLSVPVKFLGCKQEKMNFPNFKQKGIHEKRMKYSQNSNNRGRTKLGRTEVGADTGRSTNQKVS
jgi:hypothetical protein